MAQECWQKSKESKGDGNPKDNPKVPRVPKVRTKVRAHKLVCLVLKTRKQFEGRTKWRNTGLPGTKVGRNPMSIPQDHSLGSFDLGAVSSPHRFKWVKMNLGTRAAVSTNPLNFGPDGAGDGKCYTERPVASAFLTLDNFKATTNIAQVFFLTRRVTGVHNVPRPIRVHHRISVELVLLASHPCVDHSCPHALSWRACHALHFLWESLFLVWVSSQQSLAVVDVHSARHVPRCACALLRTREAPWATTRDVVSRRSTLHSDHHMWSDRRKELVYTSRFVRVIRDRSVWKGSAS